MSELTTWLVAGFLGGIVGNLVEWLRRNAELKQAWAEAREHRARRWAAVDTLNALRRVVKRSLACGQLEKLDDAKPYLEDEE